MEKNNSKVFRLENEPQTLQFTYHFNNLISGFHASNAAMRVENDKLYFCKTSQIVSLFRLLINHPTMVNGYLYSSSINMRFANPIHFRCAQLVQHYGPEFVDAWL